MKKASKRGSTGMGYSLLIGLVAIVALLAIEDGGSSVTNLFGGVADTLEDAGTAAGGGAPEGGLSITAQVPTSGASDVAVTIVPSLTFSEAIAAGDGVDLGVEISILCDASGLSFSPSISNNQLLMPTDSGLTGAASCTVTIPAGTIVAASDGTAFGGTSWSFGTIGGSNAYGWGWQFRQALGNSSSSDQSLPTAVEGGRSYAAVTAGYNHSCAIEAGTGAAYCWGFGSSGQLGAGDFNSQQLPVLVLGGLAFSRISGGGEHTCGISGGSAYCWGKNTDRQLGNGSSSNASGVQLVSGGHSWVMISAGHNHSCGVTTTGAGYCWGNGGSGRLGYGGTSTQSTPALVSGGHSWAEIWAGSSHSCGRTTAGIAYCWGDGGNGRLGNGGASSNTPTLVSGGLTFASLVAGQVHSCALTSSGAAWCWGNGGSGRLGIDDTGIQSTPVAVQGGLSFDSISANGSHTCGLVGNTGYCWGNGSNGRLGIGSTAQQTSPTQITSQSFSQISVGQAHTMGVD